MTPAGILKALPASLDWMVFFRLDAIRTFVDDDRIRRMFFVPADIDLLPYSHVVLSSIGRFLAPLHEAPLCLIFGDHVYEFPSPPESVGERYARQLALFPPGEADCIGLGCRQPLAPVLLHIAIRGDSGNALSLFSKRPDTTHYELLNAVGVEYQGGIDVDQGFMASFRNRLPTHLHAGHLSHYSRTGHCNEFFLRHGQIDDELKTGLLQAAQDRVQAGHRRGLEAAIQLSRRAASETLAMTCHPPSPEKPFPYGDLVPLGFLLDAIQDTGAPYDELRARLDAERAGLLWAFHRQRLVTATDSALILQGYHSPEAVQALERFADGAGGYYPQLWSETGAPGTMQWTESNRHWCQPDFATTCLIRHLRAQAGLPSVTPLAYIENRLETRSGLFFANPYFVDWLAALALANDPRLIAEIAGSRNADYSFGVFDPALSTAFAILALAACGYRGRLIRLSQLRLLDWLEADGLWPSSRPFYSTFRSGETHELSLYEDSFRIIGTAAAIRALGVPCDDSRGEIPPMSESVHARYRCATHLDYIVAHALPPYCPKGRSEIIPRAALAAIVARASTLDERLHSGRFLTEPDPVQSQRRLEQWCESAAKGDRALFAELLSLRRLETGMLEKPLGLVRLAESQPIPAWTEWLRACFERAASYDLNAQPRFFSAAEPMPFQQLLAPFIIEAVECLRARTGSLYHRLQSQPHQVAERLLLSWLANICGGAFLLDFSIYRLRGNAKKRSHESGDLLQAYGREMLTGGFLTFFSEYAVLARAVCGVLANWQDAMAEFLTRLAADEQDLTTTFGNGSPLGDVTDLKTGLSDPHHGGRTVFSLRFSSGVQLVYKPKCLDTDDAYSRLLVWFNSLRPSLPLRACQVLNRGAYGWVEYLTWKPCLDNGGRSAFYRRGGMLLALFHVLQATDVHSDNLIAVEEHPMLVDSETLIMPHLRSAEETRPWAESRVSELLDESVLKTSMLPNWREDDNGRGQDLSGLGGVGGDPATVAVWEDSATDRIQQQKTQVTTSRKSNVPFPEGEPADPSRFVEDVVSGFEEAYTLMLSRRDELVGVSSPLRAIGRAPIRLVFRDTSTYYGVLKKSLEPNLLRDGADRSIFLDVLSRILCISVPRERHLPLITAERHSIERLDIPVFTFSPDERALCSEGQVISPDYFSQAAYDKVLQNCRDLSAHRRQEQVRIIRGSFYAKRLNQQSPNQPQPNQSQPNCAQTIPAARKSSAHEWITPAIAIARELDARSVKGADGSTTWVALTYWPAVESYRFVPLNHSLFDGHSGIVLFLAALFRTTGDPQFLTQAENALAPTKRFLEAILEHAPWNRSRKRHQEACLLVYPLVRIAQLLDCDGILDLASCASTLATPELIAAGPAELLAGLRALAEVRPDPALTERVRLCLDHLPSPTPVSLEDTTREVEAIAARPLAPEDTLRNGVFANVDFCLEAGHIFHRPDWIEQAREQAASALSRADAAGGYRLFANLPVDAYSPGFVLGTAGIGYELLRLADFSLLHSIKRWS